MQYLIFTLFLLLSSSVFSETLELLPHSSKTELRDITLGMHINNVPENHFKNFICVNGKKELNKLSDFEQCSHDDKYLYEIGLEFDTTENKWAKGNDDLTETTISGFPVILSFLINKQGLIQAIKAFTSPDTPGYKKRQAYLLANRVKSHYGSANWECIDKQAGTDGNKAIGPVFIDQHCTKSIYNKRIMVESKFYRAPGQKGKELTNSSAFEIFNLK